MLTVCFRQSQRRIRMLHKTLKIRYLLILGCSLAALPLFAIADGQHNDKTCYAETAGGLETSSPCSARGTTCNDDFTCSIDGLEGEMRDGLEMNKSEIINDIADGPVDSNAQDAASAKAKKLREKGSGMASGKRKLTPVTSSDDAKADAKKHNWVNSPARNRAVEATDYNSSRSNKADGVALDESGGGDTDSDDDSDSDSISNAADYNSSRSNRGRSSSVGNYTECNDKDNDCDDVGANHNSTRSNKTKPVAGDGADDSDDSDDEGEKK